MYVYVNEGEGKKLPLAGHVARPVERWYMFRLAWWRRVCVVVVVVVVAVVVVIVRAMQQGVDRYVVRTFETVARWPAMRDEPRLRLPWAFLLWLND